VISGKHYRPGSEPIRGDTRRWSQLPAPIDAQKNVLYNAYPFVVVHVTVLLIFGGLAAGTHILDNHGFGLILFQKQGGLSQSERGTEWQALHEYYYRIT
jgi:hypothetical protein